MSHDARSDTRKGRANPVGSKNRVLPGWGLSIGVTLAYLGVVVFLPLGVLVLRALELSWDEFWGLAMHPRALAAYRLTFGAALVAAGVNACFGTMVAWVLMRYSFPGRRLLDALVDFPFALPTAVAGLTLADLFSSQGWLGKFLEEWGVSVAYSQLGVVVALTFVGLPFVVRTLQPVLAALDTQVEEAAASLGAGRFRTFFSVVLPALLPAILTGFSLALARAIGEYGSVVFIAGNRMYETEIAPLLVIVRLEEFNTPGAVAIAVVLLVVSFSLLAGVSLLERRVRSKLA